MKGIGIFVVLLLVAFGVAMYWFTRPPNRHLGVEGRAWVTTFVAWRDREYRTADRTYVGMGFSSERRNAHLMAPLRDCAASFARLGKAPTLLKTIAADVDSACREAEVAISVNDRFGIASLATTKRHLNQAEEWLVQAASDLHERLGTSATSST